MFSGLNSAWLNFSVIILVQFSVFVVSLYLTHKTRPRFLNWSSFPRLFITALILGFAFDFIIGKSNNIFTYTLPLTPSFATINGFLSYGLALFTATLLPFKLAHFLPSKSKPTPFYYGLMAAIILLCFLSLDSFSGLTKAVCLGVLILTLDELVLLSFGKLGPILQCLLESKGTNLIILWKYAFLIGCIYEAANYFFPVWHWHILSGSPPYMSFVAVTVFGYFVLFHPCIILSAMMADRKLL